MTETTRLLQTMIRNQCINTGATDSGHEYRNCQVLDQFFSKKGITGEVLEALPGRGNYLVRIPGTDPSAPSLMFQGHIDVVPARAEDWDFPPFEAQIKEGILYGRGAVDMLNITASMAVGFARALEEKGPFPGDLLFLALADEEASGRYGAKFLTENHWDKVKCDYQISELGGFHLTTPQGPSLTLARGEKGVLWTRISLKGRAAHGSMPYKADNAAYKIARVLTLLQEFDGDPQFHELYRDMAALSAADSQEQALLTSPQGFYQGLEAVHQRDPGWARFLHAAATMGISPGLLQAGDKVNIIPDRGVVELDIRIIPGEDKESALKTLREILKPMLPELTIEVFEYFPPNLSPKDTPLRSALVEITSGHFPEYSIADMLTGGVTDGRYWRRKGTCVYGFSLFDPELTLDSYSQRLHGINERISLKSLQKSTDFFSQLPDIFYTHWKNPKKSI